jgi:inner membrane protein
MLMDNLSHTLISVLVGETIARVLPAARSSLPDPTRRGLVVGLMAVGANLPDLDFIYSSITHNKLDYLLQHRGHTHTVLGALVIATLTIVVCRAWLKYRGLQPSLRDLGVLLGVALFAPLLHIAMDFTNSYGVHPFWPLHNEWLYGDAVFIVEPLLWVAAAPLVFVLRTKIARVLVSLALLAAVALSIVTGMVPHSLVVALTLLIATLLAVGRYAAPRTALFAGVATWLLTTCCFVVASHRAAKELAALTAQSEMKLLDHVLTPMPANPFCWDTLLIQSDGTHYALRQATLSLAPHWISAQNCPSRGADDITAPRVPVLTANTKSLHWRGKVVLPLAELKRLAAAHCEMSDLLRFARAPFFVARDGREIVGDLRYDLEPEVAFTELELGKDRCPGFVPKWQPPRADLLSAQ